MKTWGTLAALLAVGLAAPVWAQNRAQGPTEATAAEAEDCLLNRRNGRWVPSGMPQIRRVSGDASTDAIGYAGQIDGMSVYITDYRCDYIGYEVTLVGSNADNLPAYLSALRKIERAMGFSNLGRLSPADLRRLDETRQFQWKQGDLFGDITYSGDLRYSMRLTALYFDRSN